MWNNIWRGGEWCWGDYNIWALKLNSANLLSSRRKYVIWAIWFPKTACALIHVNLKWCPIGPLTLSFPFMGSPVEIAIFRHGFAPLHQDGRLLRNLFVPLVTCWTDMLDWQMSTELQSTKSKTHHCTNAKITIHIYFPIILKADTSCGDFGTLLSQESVEKLSLIV